MRCKSLDEGKRRVKVTARESSYQKECGGYDERGEERKTGL
jgi:hypothetical protein